MLKSLKVKYFQGYEEADIKFHEGVNCIYGSSSSGKTSIFRAFELARFNRPLGFRFHSHFDEDNSTEIEITTNQHTVKFKKKERTASYEIFENGLSIVQFPKVGSKVPDAISQALNFDSTLIQQQLDQHFLITGSNSKFAKEINRVTDFDKVDMWKKKLSNKIKMARNLIQYTNSELESKQKELEQYSNTDKLIKIASALNNLNKLQIELENKIVNLAELLLTYNEIETLYTASKNKLNAKRKLSEAWQLETELDILEDFENHVKLHKTYSNAHNRLTSQINRLEDIIILLKAKEYEKETIKEKWNSANNSIRVNKQWQEKLKEADYVRSEMLTELKKMKQCPFCKGKINDDCIARLIN